MAFIRQWSTVWEFLKTIFFNCSTNMAPAISFSIGVFWALLVPTIWSWFKSPCVEGEVTR